ncbi:MAG TPA: 2-oxoglutarate dehydrogenase E1 component [Pirellulaceae bacterium]|nr:2-oxoglutarate dehydrogenase E1 component [Pirellulaceae bacterium]
MNVASQTYLDALFQDYLQSPDSVPAEWRDYFQKYLAGVRDGQAGDGNGRLTGTNFRSDAPGELGIAQLQDRVDQLVRGYRVRGHLEAKLDPLGMPRPTNQELDPASYGLRPEDFPRKVSSRTIEGADERTLEDLVNLLRTTYCRSIGAQFMHIDDQHVRHWLQSRMERTHNRVALDRLTQLRILTRLTDAVIFEEFIRRKYMGAKTFSLEGSETLIPLLDLALEKAAQHGIKEVVMGMAHRGRLNVLANLLGKRAQNIFWGFEDAEPDLHRGGGDVMYHLGYSNNWTTSDGQIVHISLCFNPSHLEFVNPVAMGRCRSKQDRFGDQDRTQCMPILIHGDAAFIGEGIVQESLNLSELLGYRVGGTLHVIVNNQIGFTTDPMESRSTTYASDVAKMLQIPIFHVNGEDPEAVAAVVDLAMEFRREFHRDVVIDMYCYRRLGHNESDEPRFTQPVMYRVIDARPTIRDSYLKHLLKLQEVTAEEADRIAEARKAVLEAEFETARNKQINSDVQTLSGLWNGYYGGPERTDDDLDTGAEPSQLALVIRQLGNVPTGFNVHRKLDRMIAARVDMSEEKRPIDWATAELAAMGTLALAGHGIRLTGQDSERGTFSQRHAVLIDAETGQKYCALQHLSKQQARVEIINSPLCEAAALGFEYGYSLDAADSLVIWEAQFGDFWNAAQVIVDQFISSAEFKWRRLSGLVMLLPHGLEGAGPEHCSARLERFLTLAAQHNLQITYPTTAAQYFHLLRRQVLRPWRKPLIVLTPKSLLREPVVMSSMAELVSGRFQRVLPDPKSAELQAPRYVVLCSGKVAFELLKHRDESGQRDIAILRVEQLYPFPQAELAEHLESFSEGIPVLWVQEEPRNMGAWRFVRIQWEELGFQERWPLSAVTRPEGASPATGSKKAHALEQSELIQAVFDFNPNTLVRLMQNTN